MPVPSRGEVEFLENAENFVLIAGIDPDAVVADKKDRVLSLPCESDLQARGRLPAHEFYGIFQQVLPDFRQSGAVPEEGQFRLRVMLTSSPRPDRGPATAFRASCTSS